MKSNISYLIPICEGKNIASFLDYEVDQLLILIKEAQGVKHVNRFEADLCGCLEDECTCYLLEEVERLVQLNRWRG